ncbi:MAG: HAD-IA family hydrolase [Clostridia bacterium]|nr:HAD-IA family hydrolase [Clostridia bacterium]
MIEVSAGVIYDEAGRILLCQRGEGRSNAHLWEFPGGKREKGETAQDCLVRELTEELSLPVTDVQPRLVYEHGGISFTFLSARTSSLPTRTEHEDAQFVRPCALLQYDLCPADAHAARLIALSHVKHVFWDFDGTLLNSYPAMVRAFSAAAADYRIAVAPERTLALMKNCLRHCCEVIGGENDVSPDMLVRAFRQHEKDELRRGLPPMPGIPEVLRTLSRRGVRSYVATHRDLVSRDLLDTAGLLSHFSGFVTEEDGLARKPAPDMLLHLMDKHGLDPAECLMVGDRPLDTESGRNAGVLSVLIDPEERFPAAACDACVHSAEDLLPLMTGWTNPSFCAMMKNTVPAREVRTC